MTNLPKRTKSDPWIDRKFEFPIDKSVSTNQTLKITGRKKNGNRAERRSASSRPPFYRLDVPLQKIPHLTRLCFFQERCIAPDHTRETRRSKVSRTSRQEKEQWLFSVVDHIGEKTAYTLLRRGSTTSQQVQAFSQSPYEASYMHDAYVARHFFSFFLFFLFRRKIYLFIVCHVMSCIWGIFRLDRTHPCLTRVCCI